MLQFPDERRATITASEGKTAVSGLFIRRSKKLAQEAVFTSWILEFFGSAASLVELSSFYFYTLHLHSSFHRWTIMNLPQWTEQDDARLKTHLERAEGKVTWAELSRNAFPDGRFNKVECSERWKIISKPKPSRGPWTKEEDARLERLVAIHSSEKWVVIMNEMVSRTGKQCRERWHNHLDPSSELFLHALQTPLPIEVHAFRTSI